MTFWKSQRAPSAIINTSSGSATLRNTHHIAPPATTAKRNLKSLIGRIAASSESRKEYKPRDRKKSMRSRLLI